MNTPIASAFLKAAVVVSVAVAMFIGMPTVWRGMSSYFGYCPAAAKVLSEQEKQGKFLRQVNENLSQRYLELVRSGWPKWVAVSGSSTAKVAAKVGYPIVRPLSSDEMLMNLKCRFDNAPHTQPGLFQRSADGLEVVFRCSTEVERYSDDMAVKKEIWGAAFWRTVCGDALPYLGD